MQKTILVRGTYDRDMPGKHVDIVLNEVLEKNPNFRLEDVKVLGTHSYGQITLLAVFEEKQIES